jgi:ketosteroid isomerase-like protein
MTTEQEVLEAAAEIVAAFGSHDKEKYFSLFSPDATFIFHSSPNRLNTRGEYEDEWSHWEKDGFIIHSCSSINPKVTLHTEGKVAVFSHSVRTDLTMGADRIKTGERESIIFELIDGSWIAVHEHLSVDPNFVE